MKKLISVLLTAALLLSLGAAGAETFSGAETIFVEAACCTGCFSPFFATTDFDAEIAELTGGRLFAVDSAEGTASDQGTAGEAEGSRGLADLEIVENYDGSVDYNITLREDATFSDGTPVTLKDVLFSMYVLADPSYDGPSALATLPIEGMDAYRNGTDAVLSDLLVQAGRDNRDFTGWDEETQITFWADVDAAGPQLAQEIVDFCVEKYADIDGSSIGATGDQIRADAGIALRFGMTEWGFGDAWYEGATCEDFWNAIVALYGDVCTASRSVSVGSSLFDFIDGYEEKYSITVPGDEMTSISGIVATGKNTLTVHLRTADAAATEYLNLIVCPLHYYGDTALYNGEDSFGFPKGDLSIVREKDSAPLGCGAYVFKDFTEGTVTLEANPDCCAGAPIIGQLRLRTDGLGDCAEEILSGEMDAALADPDVNTLSALNEAAAGGGLSVQTAEYAGYGYIGVNAELVKVGEDAGSAASGALRKGILTMLAACREEALTAYYGDCARVLENPISEPDRTAPAAENRCYSTDAAGAAIYGEDSEEDGPAAALQAAVGFFEAAGYTYDPSAGVFTDAPEGASLEYEILIPAGGTRDHPAWEIAATAAEYLSTVGITLRIRDVDAATWYEAVEGRGAQLWAGAWQSAADPDLYPLYASDSATNYYGIADGELDSLITSGRSLDDRDFRNTIYLSAMEIVQDWAVELPLYRRDVCIVTAADSTDSGAADAVVDANAADSDAADANPSDGTTDANAADSASAVDANAADSASAGDTNAADSAAADGNPSDTAADRIINLATRPRTPMMSLK